MRVIRVMVTVLLIAGAGPAARPGLAAADADHPDSYIYVSPTVGLWTWDEEALPAGELDSRLRPVYGIRGGYAPIQALSGEIVALFGSNDLLGVEGDPGLSLTQIELSFVVNFRSLLEASWYPFVNLGAGVSMRSSEAVSRGERLFDGSHVSFHLGGGLKVDVAPTASLRFNVRDTFFTEARDFAGQELQSTYDAVELSIGLDYRIPLQGRRRPERLR